MKDLALPSVGVDIISVKRISQNINRIKSNFKNRIFTENEIQYCESKQNSHYHFASRFAGKEAVCKALNITWEKGINFKEIEILNNKNVPYVKLYGKIHQVALDEKISYIKISMSHERNYAIAFVMGVKEGWSSYYEL